MSFVDVLSVMAGFAMALTAAVRTSGSATVRFLILFFAVLLIRVQSNTKPSTRAILINEDILYTLNAVGFYIAMHHGIYCQSGSRFDAQFLCNVLAMRDDGSEADA